MAKSQLLPALTDALLTAAQRASPSTRTALGLNKKVLGELKAGKAAPWVFLTPYITEIQSRLGIPGFRDRFCTAILPASGSAQANAPWTNLPRAIVRQLVDQRLHPRTLGQRAGVHHRIIIQIVRDQPFIITKKLRAKIAEGFKVDLDTVDVYADHQRVRARHRTLNTQESTAVVPLADLILQDCDKNNITPTVWSKKHHMRETTIAALARGQQVGYSPPTAVRLGEIIGVASEEINRSLRANEEFPSGSVPEIQRLVVERMMATKITQRDLEVQTGLDGPYLSKLIKTGHLSSEANLLSPWRLMRWLGLTRHQFVVAGMMGSRNRADGNLSRQGRTAFPTNRRSFTRAQTSAQTDDQREMKILLFWRRASEESKRKVEEILLGEI